MPTVIEDKHASLMQDGLNLGAPVAAEEALPDGGSRQVFAFGRIYFHPRNGAAFECHGLILQRYQELGETGSGLGYPVSDEEDDPEVLGGRLNRFELGRLLFDPAVGVRIQFFDEPLRPQVVVKIDDSIPLRIGAGGSIGLGDLAAAAGPFGAAPAVALIAQFMPDLGFGRAFDPLDPGTLIGMVEQARKIDPDYAPPLLDNFLVVDCPIGFDTGSLVAALSQWAGVVEHAYIAGEPSNPQVVAVNNPLFAGQHYLRAAPEGIGVQTAWDRGLDGGGVTFVDVEQGWFFDHEDLPRGIPLLGGANTRGSFGHGAAVLGTVVGLDNDRGGVGIAPAASVSVTSIRRTVPLTLAEHARNMAGSIADAVARMPEGGILLLEIQLTGLLNGVEVRLPAEIDPAVFEAIRLATALGVVVIEAAGNAGVVLDDFVDRDGRHVLSREAGPELRDSGAIIVAACLPQTPHPPDTDFNTGSRIDCHAWGSNILAAGGWFHPETPNAYFFFSGTSGASAIIAGVAILVQQMMSGALGRPLTSVEMRRILGDPANGTASTGGAVDRIGAMPDLAKIIANELI